MKHCQMVDLLEQLPEPKSSYIDGPDIIPVRNISELSCSSTVYPLAEKAPSAKDSETSLSHQAAKTLKEKDIADMIIDSASDIEVLGSQEATVNRLKDVLVKALSGISIKYGQDIPGSSNLSSSPRTVIPDSSSSDQLDKTDNKVLILFAEKPDEQLTQLFKKQNFGIMITSDYEGLLAELQQGEHYDIIYLDIDNGPEVAKSLQEMETKALIIGIVADVEEFDTVGEELVANGVNEVLVKPVSVDGVESVLATNGLLTNPMAPTAFKNVFSTYCQMLELLHQFQRPTSLAQDSTPLPP